jgi:SAM-dependent methyltransferase
MTGRPPVVGSDGGAPSAAMSPADELPPIEASIDGGAFHLAAIDHALANGEIDEAGWFGGVQALIVPAYLAGDNPRAQSGHSGDEERWESARRPILAACDRSGDFLDIGCASGYLMESVQRWAADDGISLEPFGLDLAPELVGLARSRLPHWADRIWQGNALYWIPERRFDYVRTGLDYVPPHRRLDLVGHLMRHVVGRRLIVGMHNEAREGVRAEDTLTAGGYRIAGRVEVAKPDDPRVVRRAFWIDRDE